MIESYSVDEVFTLIKECISQRIADNWEYTFFENIPDSEVSSEWLDKLLNFLAEGNGRALKHIRYFQFKLICTKYSGVMPDIHKKLIEIVLSADPVLQRSYLRTLFFFYQPKELLELFCDDDQVLVNIYLLSIKNDSSEDYNGEFLKLFVERIPGFFQKYVDYLKGKDERLDSSDANRTFSLWSCDESFKLFDYLIGEIMNVSDPSSSYSFKEFVSSLLSKSSDVEDLSVQQEQWVLRFIDLISHDSQRTRYFFRLLDGISFELRRKCILYFMEANQNYETFRVIELLPLCYGGMGRLSAFSEERIEFLRSLLPYLKGLKFLNHKAHVEKIIDQEERNKEVEQINEVMWDIF